MGRAIELPDIHQVVLESNDGCLVVVRVAIVGRAENADYGREPSGTLLVQAVTFVLRFMSSDDGQQVVGD